MRNDSGSSVLVASESSGAPAAIAWQQMSVSAGRAMRAPEAARRIKPKRLHRFHKSEIYRLDGIGHAQSAVIAKKCLKTSAPVERMMYEQVLPHLPMPSLAYYGYLEDSDENWCWIFMGDAGDHKPEETDRVLVADWLAKFHRSAARQARLVNLPDRGPNYYFRELQDARGDVAAAIRTHRLAARDAEALKSLAPCLKQLELRWHEVCRPCYSVPWTVVHGDFVNKNVRIVDAAKGEQVVVLDWETAGWGPPAADLSRWPDHSAAFGAETPIGEPVVEKAIAVYLDAWSRSPFEFTRAMFDRLSSVGAIFRMVSSLRWACEQLRYGGSKGSVLVQMYAECLPQAIEAALKP